jgi:hypothetical protein
VTDQPLIDQPLDQPIKDSDISEFIEGAPSFHTILEVWATILAPARKEANAHITPQWASRICGKYDQMEFRDMPEFRDRYFAKIAELEAILLDVISQDDECLNQTSAEEDVEHNSQHYIDILTQWQVAVLGWEMDWNCTEITAAAELAAISEVHIMFFGEVGLTALLDQIQFEFTDMHRDALGLALQAYKESREGDGE